MELSKVELHYPACRVCTYQLPKMLLHIVACPTASHLFPPFIKQKRATGRLKKYLGDIFLQLGDTEMAQVQYNIAIEHLKPIGDNLWLAENLCH
ncbi:unnamed protein product [Trichobilharzia regenti]|nr:unnamed protein product [Trichobilharzia regenti]